MLKHSVLMVMMFVLMCGLSMADDVDGAPPSTRTMRCTMVPTGSQSLPTGNATVGGSYSSNVADMEKMVLRIIKVKYVNGSRLTTTLDSKSYSYTSPGVQSKYESYLFGPYTSGTLACGTAEAEGAGGTALMNGSGTSVELTIY